MKNKKVSYRSFQFSERVMFTLSLSLKKTLQIWEVVKSVHKQQTLVKITPYYCRKFQLFSLIKHVPIKISITYRFSFPFCPYTIMCHKEAAMW